MTEEWEYEEEAIVIQQQNDWLSSCPTICHSCRWLDSYYQFGCTQLAYPNTKNRCILYTHHRWFKRLWLFKKWDLHYRLWQLKVWFYQKVLRRKPNYVGSWRQWEYSDDYEEDIEDW